MFLIAVILDVAVVQRDVAGSFHHGQWRGECFRDGTLRGMEDELCRARWSGNMDISFERNADRLTLYVSPRNSTDYRCTASAILSAAELAERGREIRVISAITTRVRTTARRCKGPVRLSTIKLGDLRAALRETDGLIHIFE